MDDCKNLSDHEALIRRIAQQRRTSSWNLQKRSCFIADIHDLYGRNKHFNRTFTVEGQRFNYIIIEEFLMTNMRMIDAFKIELDKTLGTDLTIISTNRFEKIDVGIVSRSEPLELLPCDPNAFFLHARKIFDSEGVEFDDKILMNCLSATYTLHKDNRKYYSAIDSIFRKI